MVPSVRAVGKGIQALGPGGLALGAAAGWALHKLFRKHDVLTLSQAMEADQQLTDDMALFAHSYLVGKTLGAAELDKVIFAVTANTRPTWSNLYHDAFPSSGSGMVRRAQLDEFREQTKASVQLAMEQPKAQREPPTTALHACIREVPRVTIELDQERLSPLQVVQEHLALEESQNKSRFLQVAQTANDLLGLPGTTLDDVLGDHLTTPVLVRPGPAADDYPLRPMMITKLPCQDPAPPQIVTFWTAHRKQISTTEPMLVEYTADTGSETQSVQARGKALPGGLVEWTTTAGLQLPCLGTSDATASSHLVLKQPPHAQSPPLDTMTWTMRRPDVASMEQQGYVRFPALRNSLQAVLWPIDVSTLRELAPAAPWGKVTRTFDDKSKIESRNLSHLYGDPGGQFHWDGDEHPELPVQKGDRVLPPPRGWSTQERAEQYRRRNLRMYTQRQLRDKATPQLKQVASQFRRAVQGGFPNLQKSVDCVTKAQAVLRNIVADTSIPPEQKQDDPMYALKAENADLRRRLQGKINTFHTAIIRKSAPTTSGSRTLSPDFPRLDLEGTPGLSEVVQYVQTRTKSKIPKTWGDQALAMRLLSPLTRRSSMYVLFGVRNERNNILKPFYEFEESQKWKIGVQRLKTNHKVYVVTNKQLLQKAVAQMTNSRRNHIQQTNVVVLYWVRRVLSKLIPMLDRVNDNHQTMVNKLIEQSSQLNVTTPELRRHCLRHISTVCTVDQWLESLKQTHPKAFQNVEFRTGSTQLWSMLRKLVVQAAAGDQLQDDHNQEGQLAEEEAADDLEAEEEEEVQLEAEEEEEEEQGVQCQVDHSCVGELDAIALDTITQQDLPIRISGVCFDANRDEGGIREQLKTNQKEPITMAPMTENDLDRCIATEQE